ncbi:MAG: D-cysteine desulfhydrase [Rhodobiaceae bacterium]|nr:MAG: D-cysteine desulfhydrase [Rhodobiaceae bacterium]
MPQFPSDLPFYSLMNGPTPLQEMPRLRAALSEQGANCPRLFVKRDDMTGLAGGGNKTRKLEYLIGDALAQGADTIVTAGAIQSNHVRQTAAAAANAGLKVHAILFDTVDGYQDPAYRTSGNLLLDKILGAKIRIEPKDADAIAVFKEVLDAIKADGGTPYVVPVGGSNAVGSTAYAAVFLEIEEQAATQGLALDRIVHATGSLGTQSGLLAGRALAGSRTRVDGISVARPTRDALIDEVLEIANATAKRIGAGRVNDADVLVDFRYLGEGYGLPTKDMVSAVELVARTEGILLDPVYTGKAMAGMIALIKSGEISPDETIVFLHTGGMPGLFAYPSQFGNG